MKEDSGAGSGLPVPGVGQAQRQLQVPEQRASGVGHPHEREALMLRDMVKSAYLSNSTFLSWHLEGLYVRDIHT